jgi:uncharacterized protein YlxP (DUF503 family)
MSTERRMKKDAVNIRWAIDSVTLGELSKKAVQEVMGKTGMTREQVEALKLDIHTDDDYGETVAVAVVYCDRLETDEEMAVRLDYEQRNTEWERARYEELKRKFGD